MLAPWLELPGVDETIACFSEASGRDLARLGTTADADEIKDTAVTQPLLVALGLIAAEHLRLDAAGERVVAGHSIGEVTAAAVAGALTPLEAIEFATRRGAEMGAACALTPTGMSAVLGGDEATVLTALGSHGLTPANRNAAGQIVAAGALDALQALADDAPAGARIRPLSVAGAFHTDYMASAAAALDRWAATLDVADPRPILLSNADGAGVDTGADLLGRLVAQVTLPVRWDLCLATCRDLGVQAVLELAPGGVLAGIAKRELKGAEIVAIKTPDDLDKARNLIAGHAEHGQGEHMFDFRVVVTPAKGVFTRADALAEGAQVTRGTVLGTIRSNRDEYQVLAPDTGTLDEWLRHDGDIVGEGLPVVRMSAAG